MVPTDTANAVDKLKNLTDSNAGSVMGESPEGIEVRSGTDAEALLGDASFLSEWSELHRACPWATMFQGRAFVSAWYEVYRRNYAPLLVCGWREGVLCGLMTLGERRSDGAPVVAGTHQAEYQVWLTTPAHQDWFLPGAMTHFQKRYPGQELFFRYIPGGVSVESLRAAGFFVTSDVCERPLMRIDPDAAVRSLSKKSNKSRVNRLKRVGPVEMERVTDVDRFDLVLDELIWQYDLRQGAVNQSTPFLEDPLKRSFHMKLMSQPDMLYVTVLRAGEHIVSTHADYLDGTWSYLNIPTHSPHFVQHSPGKLHMLFLARQLADDGITCFDLTPGGDPWKERFANDHETVLELTIHPGRLAHVTSQLPTVLRAAAKGVLRTVGLNPATVRSMLGRIPIVGSRFVNGDNRPSRTRRAPLYSPTRRPDEAEVESVSVDQPRDLLRWMPNEDLPTKHQLLRVGLERLEANHLLYAFVRREQLLGTAWLAPTPETAGFDIDGSDGAATSRVAYDIVSANQEDAEAVSNAILCTILRDADRDGASVTIAIDPRDRLWPYVVESFGLVPVSEPQPVGSHHGGEEQ